MCSRKEFTSRWIMSPLAIILLTLQSAVPSCSAQEAVSNALTIDQTNQRHDLAPFRQSQETLRSAPITDQTAALHNLTPLMEGPEPMSVDRPGQIISALQSATSPELLAQARIGGESTQSLEALTTQIAKKEAELLRLNTHFRLECTQISKMKPWRLFLYNLAASGCSEAGITSIAASRWHYWRRPKTMTRTTAVSGPILLLIGHCITLTGVLTETALDAIKDRKTREKGFDIKTTHKKVLEIKNGLDKLLVERDALLASSGTLTSSELELAKAEGVVLKDVRDLSLSEYSQFYVRANKFFGNRDANSALTVLAAGTGGFQGSLLGLISAAKREPRLAGPAGIGFLISGATIVATPLASRLLANLRGNAARKNLDSELDNLTTKSASQLDTDRSKLEQLLAQTNQSDRSNLTNISNRLTGYVKQGALFAAQDRMNVKEKALADKELIERMIYSTLIGGTKMSWGINLAHAGFCYHAKSMLQITKGTKVVTTAKVGAGGKIVLQKATKATSTIKVVADPAPAKQFTKRVAIGATTYIPGTSLWIMDTLQNRLRGEMRNRALASQKNLPAAQLKERLDRVDEIDGAFNY